MKQTNKKESTLIIKDHMFIPKHLKLNQAETSDLLKKYNISLRQLPVILKSDPAIQTLNAKSGDVIQITRKSPTAGETTFYRVVSDG